MLNSISIKTRYNLLIVDDHPLTCTGYKLLLENKSQENGSKTYKTDTAFNFKEAVNKTLKKNTIPYDIVILDIQMPAYEEEKIFSGEDLGLRLKKQNPKIKLMVITNLSNNHKLYNIFKNLNPEAILIKSDIDEHIFIKAIENVINNKTFYSFKFNDLIRKQFTTNYTLDTVDREILYFLSIGIKTKDLPNKVYLSISGIEKRKRILRAYFNIDATSDLELLIAAKEKGFL